VQSGVCDGCAGCFCKAIAALCQALDAPQPAIAAQNAAGQPVCKRPVWLTKQRQRRTSCSDGTGAQEAAQEKGEAGRHARVHQQQQMEQQLR